MLELRPVCENCKTPLPPDSVDAMICSFECTFCMHCATEVLYNVCPNCGGGFAPRPIRPAVNRKGDNYLGVYPATKTVKFRPVDRDLHDNFAAALRDIPPHKR
ncbi:MAG: DUF1272 domain-containing protein [Gammaproteobacteria bacterium]|nr:DUF1272 domain-containing protein [Gammaproteobacteria bacterium]MDH5653151.1 DUF1272 domain-containing protein [Gammaproteobacteria bacterium]